MNLSYKMNGAIAGITCFFAAFAQAQNSQSSYDRPGNLVARTSAAIGTPQILGHPVEQIVEPGGIATFSVVLADLRDAAFQWKFNGTNIAGATGDSLILTNVTATNEGLYSVQVTNSAGNVISADAALLIDSDGDGLPDSWEIGNFGNTTSQRSSGDPDGDGISNLDEFLDGTNPNSNTSYRARLNTSIQGPGTYHVSPMRLNYALGESVTLTALPNRADYPAAFLGWSGDLAGRTNPSVLTMNTSKTVVARFANPATPAPGMVAYWRGEADATDSVGTHHGTFYNGANVTTPSVTPGLIGSALSFDGTVNVRVPYSAALEPAQITIEAWIYPTVQSGSFQAIVRRPRGPDGPSWAIGLQNGYLYFLTASGNTGGYLPLVSLNQWTHVAVTSDGTTKSIYVNGVRLTQEGGGLLVYDQLGPVTLGDTFHGRVDEVSIYNRALTPGEVAALATANSAGKDLTRPYFTSPSVLPLARVGLNYTHQFTTVFGTPPANFALAQTALPPGVALSSTGVVSGIPSAAGNYSFAARAMDAAGKFTDQVFTIPVLQPLAPPAGLVAWWRAENNAQDSAGTNHGTLVNGAGFASGEVEQAFAFSGVNQYVEIPDAPAMRPASITLEAWVMFNGGINQGIFSKRLSSGDASYYLYYFGNGTMGAGVAEESANPPTSSISLGGFSPTVGRWYHLALTFDNASKQLSLYVDGVQRVSETANRTISYDSNPVSWGRYGSNYLNGRIDEAAIYQRALTAAEIASIYNAGPAGKRPFSLFEQWKLAYLGDANAPDAGDPDGDGQSNVFEYVAGLIPIDPASRFELRIENVPDPFNPGQFLSGQKDLIFSPVMAGRSYTVESRINLMLGAWSPLASPPHSDNGIVRTVTDMNASGAVKFYRIQITKP